LPLPIQTGGWPASLESWVLALLPVFAGDEINGSSGKSQNFCLQEGQGLSPPIIFLAKYWVIQSW
jgi:hypothetical protein